MQRLVVMVVVGLVACGGEDFSIGSELGLPKPYAVLRPGISIAEAKRLVPELEQGEHRLTSQNGNVWLTPDRTRTSIRAAAIGLTRSQGEAVRKAWGPGEPIRSFRGPGMVWFDPRGHVFAQLDTTDKEPTLDIEEFQPLAELLAEGRPTHFAFEDSSMIGAPYERYAAKLEKRGEDGGNMLLPATEWSLAGTEVDVYAWHGLIHGLHVWFKDHNERVGHDLLREIDAVWGPHAIELFDGKSVPVWRDPAAGRLARFDKEVIVVKPYQPLARTLDVAAGFVGTRRARVPTTTEGLVNSIPPSEFQEPGGTMVVVQGDPTITSVELTEQASTYAVRDRVLKAIEAHYGVMVGVDAETVVREAAPRIVAGYRAGLGRGGVVTVTITK
ncbi:MAG: hypothetical protein ABI867_25820 [Kofleriaceae bacterium]